MISVIVPIYNAEKYLPETIESVLSQTYADFELILVDDGSKDNSLEIAQKYSTKDGRIRAFSQKNSGVTKARAKGVSEAKGEWICFVDSDDLLLQDALKNLLDHGDNADIVIGQVEFKGKTWPYPRFNKNFYPIDYVRALFNDSVHCGPCARLFASRLFDEMVFKISPEIVNGEDFLMNIRLAVNATKIRVFDSVVYKYVYRQGSAISKNAYSSLQYNLIFEKCVWKSLAGLRKKMLFDILRRIFFRMPQRYAKAKIRSMLSGWFWI